MDTFGKWRLFAIVAGLIGVLCSATGCAVRLSPEERSSLRRQVAGDVAVIGIVVRGESVQRSAEVMERVQRHVADVFGPRARSPERVRQAIRTQLEAVSLTNADRRAMSVTLARHAVDPIAALDLVRTEPIATLIDGQLREQARAAFICQASVLWEAGARQAANALVVEMAETFEDAVAPISEDELPAALVARYRRAVTDSIAKSELSHLKPFQTLIPHAAGWSILTTTRGDRVHPAVIEQAARLGVAMRLDKVFLVGMMNGEARALAIDVTTRALSDDLRLPALMVSRR